MNKTKILYDISLLGIGFHNKKAQTGIHRVVEETFRGLISSPEFNVSFIASQLNYEECLGYLKKYAPDQIDKFCFPPKNSFLQRIALNLRKLVYFLHQITKKTPLSLFTYKLYKHFSLILRTAGIHYDVIEPEKLKEFQIYHSPWHAFPKQIQKAPHIKQFITIYDLTPIVCPQCFAYSFLTNYFFKKYIKHFSKNDYAFCISQSCKDDLLNYRKELNPNHLFVTHLAASEYFKPAQIKDIRKIKKKYKIPEGKYILSLSSLNPRKNIEHLIKCFIKLQKEKKYEDLYLILAGPKGWKDKTIYEEISKTPILKDKIILTGFVEEQDLPALYSGALCFAYPSLYEGFGLPPLEAMACGTPVITSNVSSLPEVIGDAGILVDPTAKKELIKAIDRIYTSKELRDKLSEAGLKQAQKFSWGHYIQAIIKAYKSAS